MIHPQWIKNHAIAVPTVVVPSKVYH